ncbi:MAG: korA [Phycisphaerales bacterium]|nr:korA [Phycisphaerales bacterium]
MISTVAEQGVGDGSAAIKPRRVVPDVTVRFAGDSGDGMQLAGTQFTDTSALVGNDISTLPDFPAEIRAPAGTLAGVSGFQIHFSSSDIFTPGDAVDALVAMNPAALKTNVRSVKAGGIVIVNDDSFGANDLKKAGYASSPLEDDSLARWRVIRVPIDKLNQAAVKDSGLTAKQMDRCKNFFALGMCYWLYDRPLEPTLDYIVQKFGKKLPAVAAANAATLKAGYHFGETAELLGEQYRVEKAKLAPGVYRKITGNEAVVIGMAAAARLAGKELFYASYPITPASPILEGVADLKEFGAVSFQAEDEICAIGAAIGAAFGGALAATGTSGPGVALKSEAIGLAVMTELPLVVVDVQRGGPSTGLPTKTEQADLLQVMFGRNGECPVPVIAPASPSDCFAATVEAFRVATRYMTPVMLLSDGYIANGSEPWLVPDFAAMERMTITHPTTANDGEEFLPYLRNTDGSRPWAIPGTPGLEHRIGGLEKEDVTGSVSYDPANHQRMVRLRAAKVAGIEPAGAAYLWTGPQSGELLLLGWGGTFGAIKAAALELAKQGVAVSACHVRYLNPLPADLGDILKRFAKVLVPELNMGQLRLLVRGKYLVDARGLNKVQGQPFTIGEIVEGAAAFLRGEIASESRIVSTELPTAQTVLSSEG